MKYLIFDFDGVLADTYEARLEVIGKMDGQSRQEVIAARDGYFDKSTHTRDLNLSEQTLKDMKVWYKQYGINLMNRGFNLFSDFIKEIGKISDVKLAVVSSGSNVYVRPKLEDCGLRFTHILGFEDHHSKEEKVERICKDWEVDLKKVYFFTDSISDFMELKNILDPNRIYGCAWGYQGYEKLLPVFKKNNILNNFSDIHKALE